LAACFGRVQKAGESANPLAKVSSSLERTGFFRYCSNENIFIGDDSLSHRAYLPLIILFAAITAAVAHAAPANSIFANAAPSGAIAAGEQDTPDEHEILIGTGDFNRDGIADLVEATSPQGNGSGAHVLTVLLGRAGGKFVAVASHNLIGSDPRALVAGDFNGDGNTDVIVGDADGALEEFLGDGKGNLADAGEIAALGSVASMAIGHFTHDGHLDLVVSDFESNSAVILLGTGNGSFRRVWSFQLPRRGRQFLIATADFNKDGIADLVITNEDDDNYEVMLGNGNGTFTSSPELSHLRDPNSYCPS
jgi:FG-GAP-like repeat